MKHHTLFYKILAALLLTLTISASGAAFAQDAPTITVSSAPKLMSEGVSEKQATKAVKGKVNLNGLKAKDYAIIAFIDNGQWIKPYWDNYMTKVKSSGSFSVKITTGGHDTDIDEFRLFLVKRADFKDRSGYPTVQEVMELCVADSGSLKKAILSKGEIKNEPLPIPGICHAPRRCGGRGCKRNGCDGRFSVPWAIEARGGARCGFSQSAEKCDPSGRRGHLRSQRYLQAARCKHVQSPGAASRGGRQGRLRPAACARRAFFYRGGVRARERR